MHADELRYFRMRIWDLIFPVARLEWVVHICGDIGRIGSDCICLVTEAKKIADIFNPPLFEREISVQ